MVTRRRHPFASLNVLEQLGLLFILMDNAPSPHRRARLTQIEVPEMPPYKPVTSKAQSRKLFALANRGEISKSEAEGKTRAADFKSLPERKGRKVTRRARTSRR